MTPASAGSRNRRLRLQSPAPARDALGQPRPSWADVATVWAHVREPRSWELVNATQQTGVRQLVAECAYQASLALPDATWRALMTVSGQTRVLNVAGVRNPDERNRTMLLDLTEQTSPAEAP